MTIYSKIISYPKTGVEEKNNHSNKTTVELRKKKKNLLKWNY